MVFLLLASYSPRNGPVLVTELTPPFQFCLLELVSPLLPLFLIIYYCAQRTSRAANLADINISGGQTADASYSFSLMFPHRLPPLYSHPLDFSRQTRTGRCCHRLSVVDGHNGGRGRRCLLLVV